MPWMVFDAVGTLLVPREPVAATYQAVGQAHGSVLTEAEVGPRFQRVFAESEGLVFHPDGTISPGLATSEDAEYRRWRWVVGQVFDDLAPDQQTRVFEALWRHYAQPAAWRLLPDVAETLAEVHQMGWRLAIASNFDARLEGLLRGFAALGTIERVAISSRLGWRKPAPEFFAQVAELCGSRPDELCMVGDHWDHDVQAARAAGWQAVRVFSPLAPRDEHSEGMWLRDLPGWLRKVRG